MTKETDTLDEAFIIAMAREPGVCKIMYNSRYKSHFRFTREQLIAFSKRIRAADPAPKHELPPSD